MVLACFMVLAAVQAVAVALLVIGQIQANRRWERMMESHEKLIEHLTVAANPEAWLTQQNDRYKQERRAELKAAKARIDKDAPERRGVM